MHGPVDIEAFVARTAGYVEEMTGKRPTREQVLAMSADDLADVGAWLNARAEAQAAELAVLDDALDAATTLARPGEQTGDVVRRLGYVPEPFRVLAALLAAAD